ncbi:hypothetical protein [Actinoplanes aureus]|uniref:Secreted protein n=1 Tax=Actinoplanes aureus TaxID=2792083 RepID=A0A931CB34_9ACTN|nr:hypothetical protein [Actinoplanes aureus]MBG0563858.1 hypothetical protein [Actinoplanes aureus]
MLADLSAVARRTAAAAAATVLVMLGAAAPARAAAPGPTPDLMPAASLRTLNTAVAAGATNFIYNEPEANLPFGVIHLRDYNYAKGNYDIALPPGESTLQWWGTTAGWYTAPGYCTQQYRSDHGGPFHRQTPDLGPGIHYIGAYTTYAVYMYRMRSPNAC